MSTEQTKQQMKDCMFACGGTFCKENLKSFWQVFILYSTPTIKALFKNSLGIVFKMSVDGYNRI